MWIVERQLRLAAKAFALSRFNVLRDARFRREVLGARSELVDLTRYERRIRSQNGEDGILEAIFARVGTTNRFFVEFGAGDGSECNSRHLREHRGWRGVLWDAAHGDPERSLHREFVTTSGVDELFGRYEVPLEPDLLGIDIDGNDIWVWEALDARWRPRVVVIEYNGSVGPRDALAVPYDPQFRWDGTSYYGASLRAIDDVARGKGYTLVACDSMGVNAFFVRDDLVPAIGRRASVEALFRPLAHGRHLDGHPQSRRRLAPFPPRR